MIVTAQNSKGEIHLSMLLTMPPSFFGFFENFCVLRKEHWGLTCDRYNVGLTSIWFFYWFVITVQSLSDCSVLKTTNYLDKNIFLVQVSLTQGLVASVLSCPVGWGWSAAAPSLVRLWNLTRSSSHVEFIRYQMRNMVSIKQIITGLLQKQRLSATNFFLRQYEERDCREGIGKRIV